MQHQKAVTSLKRQQQCEGLWAVLLQLGNLAWLGRKEDLASRSWREAVEACFWRRNLLQEWPLLDARFFAPNKDQVDIRLRSLVPLQRWASVTHRRSHHEQLRAALLASRILKGVLVTAAEYPLPAATGGHSGNEPQLYAARSDGGITRHRMKQLHGYIQLLPTSLLSPTHQDSRAPAAELVEAFLWFACLLRCCDYARVETFAFLAVAEYVAADICKNIQMSTHCRIMRILLCIE